MPRIRLIAFLLACSACSDSNPPKVALPLDESWLAVVVADPARFTNVVDGTSREGWQAYHHNQYKEATEAFTGNDDPMKTARGRSLWELAMLYDDLTRISDFAWAATFETWRDRSGIPAGSSMPYIAGLAALDSGDAAAARPWFDLAARSQDPQVAAAAAILSAIPALDAPLEESGLPLIERVNSHLRSRHTGDISSLLAYASKPLISERLSNKDGSPGVEHRFYDPMAMRTYSMAYKAQASRALGTDAPFKVLTHPATGSDPLASLLFSPVTSLTDLASEGERAQEHPGTLGAGASALPGMGFHTPSPSDDDAEWARQQLRALNASLDAWRLAQEGAAPPDGLSILDDLDLTMVFRSRLLLGLGRQAIEDHHPRQALAMAQMAIDLESPRDITPINHPGLQAIIVESNLLTGHTREALDGLQVLVTTHTELTGLDEVIGDLAILQGLDRQGDSKEN